MNKKILYILVLILAFFMLATPLNASAEEDLHPDANYVDNSNTHEYDQIPGYGIVAYRISLTADPDKIPADGISTSTIIAQLKDRKGNDVKVENVIIRFKTTRGTLSATSVATDDNGKATVTLTSGTKHGTALLKVTSDSVLIPQVTKVKFVKVNSDEKDHDGEVLGFNTNFEDLMTTLNDAIDEYLTA